MTQLRPGDVFANRFDIVAVAGAGGMGTVYRARDRFSGETVALKLIHGPGQDSNEDERFAREAQLLAELRHPGIVSHVAHGQTPAGLRFLAMEWLDGHDLAQRLSLGPLTLPEALLMIQGVSCALAVAHQRTIIHRDLKPTNLFLPEGDVARVKILDFGIARRLNHGGGVTRTGTIIGTPEYMAPEQARGMRDISPAADIFSLGCVLYECLAGEPPFVGEHIAAVLLRILLEQPVSIAERRPMIPPSVGALLDRMLRKDPAERFSTAGELSTFLAELGAVTELPLLPTLAVPSRAPMAFAESQQVLFSLVVATEALSEDAAASTVLSEHVHADSERRAMLTAELRTMGLRTEWLVGGALIVTVPQTGSATDQATQAARAALLVKERWPTSSVAVATGRGTARGATTVGEVADRAAGLLANRTQNSAKESSTQNTGVWMDQLSTQLLGPGFLVTKTDQGQMLVGEEREADESRPLLGKPTPCTGRETELATLEAQFNGCVQESEARAVLITAPPGIGKSRLRHELYRRLDQRNESVTRLLGRGDLVSSGSPYGILASAIRRLCGIFGSESIDEQRQRIRIRIEKHLKAEDKERCVFFIGELCHVPFSAESQPVFQAARHEPKIMHDNLRRAFLDWLDAELQNAPVLIALDDLQWGDALSVSLLDEAMRTFSATPLFILALGRPELHDVFPQLWQRHKLQEIVMKGLSKKACERLIQQVLGRKLPPAQLDRIITQSGGNALFLEELIRAVADGEPEGYSETVTAMLQARIGRMDLGPRRTIFAASIFGETFWRGGVAAILGLPANSSEVVGWLRGLVDSEMIQPHANSRMSVEDEYSFRHALVRDAAAGLLSDTDRALGHRSAALFLETDPGHDPAILAAHFAAGGDAARAADNYLRAAEQATERNDLDGTLKWVARGIDSASSSEVLGALHELRAHAYTWQNRTAQAWQEFDAALPLLKPGSRQWCRCLKNACMGTISLEGMARLVEVKRLLESTEPSEEGHRAYIESFGFMSAGLAYGYSWNSVRWKLARLESLCQRYKMDEPTIERFLYWARGHGQHYRRPAPWSTLLDCETGLRLAREAGDLFTAACVAGWDYDMLWFELGDLEKAIHDLRTHKAEFEKNQPLLVCHLMGLRLARLLTEREDVASLAEAESLAMTALADSNGSLMVIGDAHEALARCALRRGMFNEAQTHALALEEIYTFLPARRLLATALLIAARLADGRHAEAVLAAEEGLARLTHLGGAGYQEVECRLAVSEAFYAVGHVTRAKAELGETLRQIQLRADDISDPFWRNSYLTRNPSCIRAQQLGLDWAVVGRQKIEMAKA